MTGLHVINNKTAEISIEGDEKVVINALVSQYEQFFGKAAREVCKEAAASLVADLTPADVPSSLQ